MKDIVPDLQEAIEKDFNVMFRKNEKIKSIQKMIEEGTATYADANEFSIEVGLILASSFRKNLSSKVLPEGRMYFNIAERILGATLGNNHKIIAGASAQVQQQLNKASGLGLKAIEVKANQDRIKGFVERLSSEPIFDDVAWILDEPVVNYSQSVVDETIKANAEFHQRAGLEPKIVRTLAGGACDWCKEMAGSYSYPDVPDDVYRRHERCRCTVEYNPADGRKQDVYSKRWK